MSIWMDPRGGFSYLALVLSAVVVGVLVGCFWAWLTGMFL